MIVKFKHFSELLWEMTINELKIRYKKTYLGFIWALLYPLIQAIVIGFVFRYISPEVYSSYTSTLFLNLIIWNFFSSSVGNATPSIVQNRSLIKRAKFPYMTVPLSIVLCNGIHMISTLFVLFFFIRIMKISNGINIFSLLIGLSLIVLFTGCLALITSAVNTKIRDIYYITQAGLMIWFYATPVIYPVSKIPNHLIYLWNFNPLVEIIMLFQNAFFSNQINTSLISIGTILILLTVPLGIYTFKHFEGYFDDYI